MSDIEIHTMLYGFQKRFWWQLSSLIEQENGPKLSYVISLHNKDPWFSWNEKIINTFSRYISINSIIWDDDMFGIRGQVRNKSMLSCKSSWIVFNDADMIYPKDFFNKFWVGLGRIPDEHRVIGTGRKTVLKVEDADKLIESEKYDLPINNSFNKCSNLILRNITGAYGVGFFQCVNVENYRKYQAENGRDGSYVGEYKRDWSILSDKPHTRTNSDRCFRIRAGGAIAIPDIFAIHLQHFRGPANGVQR
ncbi:MAG: hypothetical protein AABY32_02120 [Nanoarchaeota archaeon]